jgi:hypothetical protein
MSEDVQANIRRRVAQCCRLAEPVTDEKTRAILRQMADEGEADIRRLQAEGPSTDALPS